MKEHSVYLKSSASSSLSHTWRCLECSLPYFSPHIRFPLLLFIFFKVTLHYFLYLAFVFSFGNFSKTNDYRSHSFFLIAAYYSLWIYQRHSTMFLQIVLFPPGTFFLGDSLPRMTLLTQWYTNYLFHEIQLDWFPKSAKTGHSHYTYYFSHILTYNILSKPFKFCHSYGYKMISNTFILCFSISDWEFIFIYFWPSRLLVCELFFIIYWFACFSIWVMISLQI